MTIDRKDIDPSDLVVRAWSSSRQGSLSLGVPSGVEIVHLPTGAVVREDSARHQYKNKEIALNRLLDLLNARVTPHR